MVNLTQFTDLSIFSPLQLSLLDILEKYGPTERDDLVAMTNSPRTTVHDNLTRLEDKSLVKRFSRPTNSRGRPKVFFKVVEE